MRKIWKGVFLFLFLVCLLSWLAFFSTLNGNLRLIACDVGQGDALIVVFRKTQILIDTGPDEKVVDCLSKNIPFWDKKLEIVILTHPQKDHMGGISAVLKAYEVDNLLMPQIDPGTFQFEVLKNTRGGRVRRVVFPDNRTKIRIGLIYLDIVWPSPDFLQEKLLRDEEEKVSFLGEELIFYKSKENINNFSIVAVLKFGDFESLFTGDIEDSVSDKVAEIIERKNYHQAIEYIKVPHHGSKNGLSKNLLLASSPKVAVISVGKNSYGHPSKEVLSILGDGIEVLRTDQEGDIVFETDGKRYWRKN